MVKQLTSGELKGGVGGIRTPGTLLGVHPLSRRAP